MMRSAYFFLTLHRRRGSSLVVAPGDNRRDPWGEEVGAKHTRIRYELKLARRAEASGVDRLYVIEEKAAPILDREDQWVKEFPSQEFKDTFVKRGRRKEWLTTREESGGRMFEIAQDGRAGRSRRADAAERTNLSSITSAEFPHLFALREELRSWRFLQLYPFTVPRGQVMGSVDR